MNKTVNINLGGMFFHIDEDAFQKLSRYFDAIKRSLTNSNGQDEIIKDIEMRVAELLSEKHINDKQVVNLREVDEVIAVMGQPEDYRIEDDSAPNDTFTPGFDGVKRRKKLYRDTEKGMLGGVATGLGHYFGIDAVWLKIMFLLFIPLGFGAGIIAYLILWIVTPAALTTAEKLEMTGEPVTISNIERKVREEFDNLSDRFKNTNYDKMGNQVKTGAERVASNIGEILMSIFRVFAKILGALIVVYAAAMLVLLIVGLFTLGSTSFVDLPWQQYIDAVNYTNIPIWIIGLLFFLAIGIPFFFLFILGLKLLVNNLKSIGSIAKYTLLALWIISVGILISLGVRQATEVAFNGKVVQKAAIDIAPTDTLYVKVAYNDYYTKDIDETDNFRFTQDDAGKAIIYSTNVNLHFMKTDEAAPYIQIEKTAEGPSLSDAKARAEKIRYSYKVEGNKVILDNYLVADQTSKYRHQQVEIYLYLPQGTIIKPDSSIQNYDESDNWFFDLHYSGDYIYKVEGSQVKCLTCPADEMDDDTEDLVTIAHDSTSTTVTVKNNSGNENPKGVTSLETGADGIIIKKQ